MKVLSVGQLNNQIKALLESTFERVSVEGEVSNITYHTSGHLYFTIKDKEAAVKCVMFRGNASRLKFRIETGMHIVCDAAVSVYAPRGEYQLNCFSVSPAGEGALALAYEQLKKRLGEKGYFDAARKKTMPRLPKRIAVITSATGAAIQDMLKVAGKRWPMVRIDVINTVVQGEQSGPSIARNIDFADRDGYDVIVIGRGGGSMEDLWGFNEEVVADSIFQASTPVVSAVGHEVDYVISDFVADLRAPTPSAAMEMLLPDQAEVLLYLDGVSDRMRDAVRQMIGKKEALLMHMRKMLQTYSVSSRLDMYLREAEGLRIRMRQLILSLLRHKEQRLIPLQESLPTRKASLIREKTHALGILKQRLESLDPSRRLLPHTAQVLKDGKGIELAELQAGETFSLTDASIRIHARVESSEKVE